MAAREKNSNISVIYFDLDNTLIATRKGDKQTCIKLSEILWEKYAVPLDHAKSSCSNFLKAFRKCPENPTMELDTWRHHLWRQALGDQYNTLAGDVYLKWLQLRYHYLALTADVLNLLNKLHQHYLLALITNGPSTSQWEKIDRLNLRPCFDLILVSGDLPWEKPQSEIFREACVYLGVEPKQCLMVGDKLETDILGGFQANLGGTVWVPLSSSSLQCEECSPDFIIEKVTDLPNLLPKNPKIRSQTSNLVSRFISSIPDLHDCNSNGSDGS